MTRGTNSYPAEPLRVATELAKGDRQLRRPDRPRHPVRRLISGLFRRPASLQTRIAHAAKPDLLRQLRSDLGIVRAPRGN
jgi:hypothetical protein